MKRYWDWTGFFESGDAVGSLYRLFRGSKFLSTFPVSPDHPGNVRSDHFPVGQKTFFMVTDDHYNIFGTGTSGRSGYFRNPLEVGKFMCVRNR